MLAVKNLNVAYENKLVVYNVSFTVSAGQLVAVVGPNGAGKTTLLKAMVGLVTPVSGVITFYNRPLCIADGSVAYIPQHTTISWDFPINVTDLVVMGSYGRLGFFARPSTQDYERAQELLERVDLIKYKNEHIGVLSGGQRQRALLARALMQNARLYLMDEPLVSVDAAAQRMILKLLKALCMDGYSVIMVHHQLFHLEEYFDALLLFNKTCIQFGSTKELLVPSILEKAYFTSAWS